MTTTFDDIAIADLPISASAVRALRLSGITTVGLLRQSTLRDLEAIEDLTPGGIDEIRDALLSCGLELQPGRQRRSAASNAPAAEPAGARRSLRRAKLRFGAFCAAISGVLAILVEEIVETAF